MLDDGELDCNFTSDFTTPFMSTTSEIYLTSLTYPTSTKYSVDPSSTDSSDVATEMITEKTDYSSVDYETEEMTTIPSSTVELTTNVSFTSESSSDSTNANPIYWTTESTTDVSQMYGSGGSVSMKTTEWQSTSSVTSEITSSTTEDSIYKSTTDFNPVISDTTLSGSFFTDYPTVKTSTEPTIDVSRSVVTIETTTEYVVSATTGSDDNVTTAAEPRTPACLNKMCQNGGTCVPTPEGAKVRISLYSEVYQAIE